MAHSDSINQPVKPIMTSMDFWRLIICFDDFTTPTGANGLDGLLYGGFDLASEHPLTSSGDGKIKLIVVCSLSQPSKLLWERCDVSENMHIGVFRKMQLYI